MNIKFNKINKELLKTKKGFKLAFASLVLTGAIAITSLSNGHAKKIETKAEVSQDVDKTTPKYKKVAEHSYYAGLHDIYEVGIREDDSLMADYAFFDSGNLLGINPCGKCVSKGFEDYKSYEKTGVKTSSKTINEAAYIALTSMVGVTDLKELETLNTPKLIEKMDEKGFSDSFGKLFYLDQIVCTNYNSACEWDSEPREQDVTQIFEEIFEEYVNNLQEQGKTTEEIEASTTDIINRIKARVDIHVMENSETRISENNGLVYISLTKLENAIKEINAVKVNMK